MENPALVGEAAITNGAYTEYQTGLSVAGLHSTASGVYSPDGSTITFSAARAAAIKKGMIRLSSTAL